MWSGIWALIKAAGVALGWAKQANDQEVGAKLQDDAAKTEVLNDVVKAKSVDDAADHVSVDDKRKWLRENSSLSQP